MSNISNNSCNMCVEESIPVPSYADIMHPISLQGNLEKRCDILLSLTYDIGFLIKQTLGNGSLWPIFLSLVYLIRVASLLRMSNNTTTVRKFNMENTVNPKVLVIVLMMHKSILDQLQLYVIHYQFTLYLPNLQLCLKNLFPA